VPSLIVIRRTALLASIRRVPAAYGSTTAALFSHALTALTEPLSTDRQIRIDSLEASGCLGKGVFCKSHAELDEKNGRRRQQG
jgi:hypothetical protein